MEKRPEDTRVVVGMSGGVDSSVASPFTSAVTPDFSSVLMMMFLNSLYFAVFSSLSRFERTTASFKPAMPGTFSKMYRASQA